MKKHLVFYIATIFLLEVTAYSQKSPLGSLERSKPLKTEEVTSLPSLSELTPEQSGLCKQRYLDQWPDLQNRVQELLNSSLHCWTPEQQNDLSEFSEKMNTVYLGTQEQKNSTLQEIVETYSGVQNLISACRTKFLVRNRSSVDHTFPSEDFSDRLLLHVLGDVFGQGSGLEDGIDNVAILEKRLQTVKSFAHDLAQQSFLSDKKMVAPCADFIRMEKLTRGAIPIADPSPEQFKKVIRQLEEAKILSNYILGGDFELFAAGFSDSVLGLKKSGDNFFFMGGWASENVIFEVELNKDTEAGPSYAFRIYNAGQGANYHSSLDLPGGKRRNFPYFEKIEVTQPYLLSIPFIKFLHESRQDAKAKISSVMKRPEIQTIIDNRVTNFARSLIPNKVNQDITDIGNKVDADYLANPDLPYHAVSYILDGIQTTHMVGDDAFLPLQISRTSSYYSIPYYYSGRNSDDRPFTDFIEWHFRLSFLEEYVRTNEVRLGSYEKIYNLVKKSVFYFSESAASALRAHTVDVGYAQTAIDSIESYRAILVDAYAMLSAAWLSKKGSAKDLDTSQESSSLSSLTYALPGGIKKEHYQVLTKLLPSYAQWSPDPESIAKDLNDFIQLLRPMIDRKSHLGLEQSQVLVRLQEFVQRLPIGPDATRFWEKAPDIKASLGLLRKLSEFYLWTLNDHSYHLWQSSRGISPVDYLVQVKILTVADQMTQELKRREPKSIINTIPSLWMESLRPYILKDSLLIALHDPVWTEEYQKIAAYWKTAKNDKEDYFQVSNGRAFKQQRFYEFGESEMGISLEFLEDSSSEEIESLLDEYGFNDLPAIFKANSKQISTPTKEIINDVKARVRKKVPELKKQLLGDTYFPKFIDHPETAALYALTKDLTDFEKNRLVLDNALRLKSFWRDHDLSKTKYAFHLTTAITLIYRTFAHGPNLAIRGELSRQFVSYIVALLGGSFLYQIGVQTLTVPTIIALTSLLQIQGLGALSWPWIAHIVIPIVISPIVHHFFIDASNPVAYTMALRRENDFTRSIVGKTFYDLRSIAFTSAIFAYGLFDDKTHREISEQNPDTDDAVSVDCSAAYGPRGWLCHHTLFGSRGSPIAQRIGGKLFASEIMKEVPLVRAQVYDQPYEVNEIESYDRERPRITTDTLVTRAPNRGYSNQNDKFNRHISLEAFRKIGTISQDSRAQITQSLGYFSEHNYLLTRKEYRDLLKNLIFQPGLLEQESAENNLLFQSLTKFVKTNYLKAKQDGDLLLASYYLRLNQYLFEHARVLRAKDPVVHNINLKIFLNSRQELISLAKESRDHVAKDIIFRDLLRSYLLDAEFTNSEDAAWFMIAGTSRKLYDATDNNNFEQDIENEIFGIGLKQQEVLAKFLKKDANPLNQLLNTVYPEFKIVGSWTTSSPPQYSLVAANNKIAEINTAEFAIEIGRAHLDKIPQAIFNSPYFHQMVSVKDNKAVRIGNFYELLDTKNQRVRVGIEDGRIYIRRLWGQRWYEYLATDANEGLIKLAEKQDENGLLSHFLGVFDGSSLPDFVQDAYKRTSSAFTAFFRSRDTRQDETLIPGFYHWIQVESHDDLGLTEVSAGAPLYANQLEIQKSYNEVLNFRKQDTDLAIVSLLKKGLLWGASAHEVRRVVANALTKEIMIPFEKSRTFSFLTQFEDAHFINLWQDKIDPAKITVELPRLDLKFKAEHKRFYSETYGDLLTENIPSLARTPNYLAFAKGNGSAQQQSIVVSRFELVGSSSQALSFGIFEPLFKTESRDNLSQKALVYFVDPHSDTLLPLGNSAKIYMAYLYFLNGEYVRALDLIKVLKSSPIGAFSADDFEILRWFWTREHGDLDAPANAVRLASLALGIENAKLFHQDDFLDSFKPKAKGEEKLAEGILGKIQLGISAVLQSTKDEHTDFGKVYGLFLQQESRLSSYWLPEDFEIWLFQVEQIRLSFPGRLSLLEKGHDYAERTDRTGTDLVIPESSLNEEIATTLYVTSWIDPALELVSGQSTNLSWGGSIGRLFPELYELVTHFDSPETDKKIIAIFENVGLGRPRNPKIDFKNFLKSIQIASNKSYGGLATSLLLILNSPRPAKGWPNLEELKAMSQRLQELKITDAIDETKQRFKWTSAQIPSEYKTTLEAWGLDKVLDILPTSIVKALKRTESEEDFAKRKAEEAEFKDHAKEVFSVFNPGIWNKEFSKKVKYSNSLVSLETEKGPWAEAAARVKKSPVSFERVPFAADSLPYRLKEPIVPFAELERIIAQKELTKEEKQDIENESTSLEDVFGTGTEKGSAGNFLNAIRKISPLQQSQAKSKLDDASDFLDELKKRLRAFKKQRLRKPSLEFHRQAMENLESLHKRLIDETKALKPKLNSLRDKALKIANKLPEEWASGATQSRKLETMGGVRRQTQFDQMLEWYATKNTQSLINSNEFLSADDITELFRTLGSYLLIASYINQADAIAKRSATLIASSQTLTQRCTDHLRGACEQLQGELGSFQEIASQSRAFDPAEKPANLVFEYVEKFLIRAKQMESIEGLNIQKALKENPKAKGAIYELIMGSGKTSVLLPFSSYANMNTETLSVVVLPESLIPSMAPELNEKMSKVFGLGVETLDIKRAYKYNAEKVQLILDRLKRAMRERRLLVLSNSSIQSLFLLYLDALREPHKAASVPIYAEIFKFLKKHALVTIDEVDSVMDIMQAHRFSIGEREPFNRDAFMASFGLYHLLLTDPELNSSMKLSFMNNKNEEVPPFNETVYDEKLRPLLIKKIVDPQASSVLFFQDEYSPLKSSFDALDKAELREFMMSESADHNQRYLNTIRDELLRGFIATLYTQVQSTLRLTLSKIYGIHYGLYPLLSDCGPDHWCPEFIAVPYHGGVPIPDSRFGSDLEAINYSIQSHLEERNSLRMLKHQLLYLQENYRRASPRRRKILKSILQLYFPDSSDSHFLSLKSKDMDSYAEELSKSPEKILLLSRNPLRMQLAMYNIQLSTNALIYPMIFKSIQGLTGTLWNLPALARFYDPKKIKASDTMETTLNLIWRKSSPEFKILPMVQDLSLKVSKLFEGRTAGSVIDLGGVFKGFDNQDVAREILKNCKADVHKIIFYDRNQKIKTLARDGVVLDYAPTPEDRPGRIAFWDLQHTTGSDLKVAENAKALLTINKNSILRDVMQAAWRLRGLDQGQSVDFAIASDDAEYAQSYLQNNFERKFENLGDLVFFVSVREAELLHMQTLRFLRAQMDQEIIGRVFERLLSGENHRYKQAQSLFEVQLPRNSFTNYGKPESEIPKEIALNNHQQDLLSRPSLAEILPALGDFTERFEKIKRKGLPLLPPLVRSFSLEQGSELEIETELEMELENEVEQEVEQEVQIQIYEMPNDIKERKRLEWNFEKLAKGEYFSHLATLKDLEETQNTESKDHAMIASLGIALERDKKDSLAKVFDKDIHISLNAAPVYKYDLNESTPFGFFTKFQKEYNDVLVAIDDQGQVESLTLLDREDATEIANWLAKSLFSMTKEFHNARKNGLFEGTLEGFQNLAERARAQWEIPRSSQALALYNLGGHFYRYNNPLEALAGSTLVEEYLESIKNSERFQSLLVQIKFFTGRILYSPLEFTYLERWLRSDTLKPMLEELLNNFDGSILSTREDSRALLRGSELEELFYDLENELIQFYDLDHLQSSLYSPDRELRTSAADRLLELHHKRGRVASESKKVLSDYCRSQWKEGDTFLDDSLSNKYCKWKKMTRSERFAVVWTCDDLKKDEVRCGWIHDLWKLNLIAKGDWTE